MDEDKKETSIIPNGGSMPKMYEVQNERSGSAFLDPFGGHENTSNERGWEFSGGHSEMFY
ncbi:MAG: hypothetical protein LBO09_02465 [Candidatus Peribacteria bacterium]|nr:hypothetical protein [Candidatus Peribacteria bacterium]